MAKTGPDFFVIGMQKAATKWVFDATRNHPGFKMPIIKETHHYDDRKHPIRREGKDRLARARDRVRSTANPNRQKRWNQFVKYLENGRQHDDYLALFRRADHLLSGDITPAYSALDSDSIESILARHPDLKVVLMIRDPVSRLWSAFNMYVRQELISAGADSNDVRFVEQMQGNMTLVDLDSYLKIPGVMARSFPSQIYDRWSKFCQADRLHLIFFEDLVESPITCWFDLERFISGRIADAAFVPPGNSKQSNAKIRIDPQAFAHLVDFFEAECRACSERFGDKAERWLQAYHS